MEYGTEDKLFRPDAVALPTRNKLLDSGYLWLKRMVVT